MRSLINLMETSDDDIIERAIQTFGLTTHPLEVGYILPNGKMLDFSGRHQQRDHYRRQGDRFVVKRGADYQVGQRPIDHRDLDDLVTAGYTEGMYEFMRRARAIRVKPSAGFCVLGMPTPVQIKVMALLGGFYASQGDPVYLDCCHPDGSEITAHSFARPTVAALARFLDQTYQR